MLALAVRGAADEALEAHTEPTGIRGIGWTPPALERALDVDHRPRRKRGIDRDAEVVAAGGELESSGLCEAPPTRTSRPSAAGAGGLGSSSVSASSVTPARAR
ncbi:MAG: hypothetical protein IPK07_24280 [Deltaproteobacteria bacterium]|nr:hypothetical protein [Deltaproteobacteria bacterium]